MIQIRKRILSLLLAVVMVCGLAPIGELSKIDWPTLPDGAVSSYVNDGIGAIKSAASWLGERLHGLSLRASAQTYSGNCGASGSNVTWSLDTETGVLTISGTGAMKLYDSWYTYRSSIKTVTIGSGVTTICGYAFYNCTSLANVTIPDSVTQIGDSAFEKCTCITDMTIPSGVTSIGTGAFRNCTGLLSLTFNAANCMIAGMNSSSMPNDSAFFGCTALRTVTIGETVETIPAYMMYGCLYSCAGSPTVTISNGVTQIGSYAFGYSDLAYVNIPDSVTYIGDYAFCRTSLTDVTIGNGVKQIGNVAFSGCPLLSHVTLGDAVECIGRGAFSWSPLSSVFIPRSVREIGEAAFACGIPSEYNLDIFTPTLQTIEVDPENNYFCVRDGVLFNKAQTALIQYPNADPRTEYVIPDSVACVGNYYDFFCCTNLERVHIPSCVTFINCNAFTGCTSLSLICSDAANDELEWIAEENGIEFRVCEGHSVRVAGDANGDGVLDLKDVIRIRRFLAGGWNVTLIEAASDVDADRAVTLQDAVLILRSLAGGWDVTLQ